MLVVFNEDPFIKNLLKLKYNNNRSILIVNNFFIYLFTLHFLRGSFYLQYYLSIVELGIFKCSRQKAEIVAIFLYV